VPANLIGELDDKALTNKAKTFSAGVNALSNVPVTVRQRLADLSIAGEAINVKFCALADPVDPYPGLGRKMPLACKLFVNSNPCPSSKATGRLLQDH
jgi:hypothetical protein